MQNRIQEKIEALAQEAANLSEQREQFVKAVGEIDNRLTQIVGAMAELHSLLDPPSEEPPTT